MEADSKREKSSVFEESLMRRISGSSSVHTLSKAAFIEKVRESNAACQSGDFTTGVQLYTEAIAADPQNCILYSNRSAVLVKLNEYEKALDDAVKAQQLNPKWSKVVIFVEPCRLSGHQQPTALGFIAKNIAKNDQLFFED